MFVFNINDFVWNTIWGNASYAVCGLCFTYWETLPSREEQSLLSQTILYIFKIYIKSVKNIRL